MVPRIGVATLTLACVILFAGALLWPTAAASDGALAMGMPQDLGKDGFSFGIKIKAATMEEARDEALRACRTSTAAESKARSLCTVVRTFRGECAAIAMDPEPGKSGTGWGVGKDEEAAKSAAIKMCVETANRGRQSFCQIDRVACD